MKSYVIKFINLAVIVVMLLGYNITLEAREKEDEIARLSAELESAQLVNQAISGDTEENAGNYKDGTYTGTALGFGGNVTVEVSVENGKITDISITDAASEDTAYLEMAKDIIPEILENQSADVDTISGATFSSTGIRDAVAQALEKAE